MQAKDTVQQAAEIAKAAHDSMVRHGVAPTPRNFTVWYEYCSGRNAAVSAAIDAAKQDEAGFTTERNLELYEQHFGSEREARVIHETGHQIQTSVNQILTSLSDAGRDQSDYGEKLAGFSGQLSEGMSGEDLSGLVHGIEDDTREIMTKNRGLEAKLEESAIEIAALQEHLEEVRHEAMTDGLTGIANRKHFDLALRKETTASTAAGDDLCLLLADIDLFKKFNDTYGHRVGDEVLKVVARTLQDGVKGRDTPARYGGEEFAVILPRTILEDAVTVAEQIRTTLASRALRNRKTGDSYGRVTLSVGVARYRAGETPDELIERADAALYRAKEAGRNRVESETLREQISNLAG